MRNNELYEDDYLIAQGLLPSDDPFDITQAFNLESYLYKKLLFYPDLQTVDTLFLNFFLSKQGSNLARLVEIQKDLRDLYWSEENWRTQLALNADLTEALMDSLQANVLACTEASETELPVLLAAQFGILEELAAVKANTLDILHQVETHRLGAQPGLLSANQSIPCVEAFELNQQAVNDTWIDQLVNDSLVLDNQQMPVLTDIAGQCPFLGGSAVYTARAMLAAAQSGGVFTDNCPGGDFPDQQQEGNYVNREKTTSSVYPNPVTDLLMVNLEDHSEPGTLEIRNSSGKLVLSVRTEAGATSRPINVSRLASGIYTVSYFSKQRLEFSETFVKQ